MQEDNFGFIQNVSKCVTWIYICEKFKESIMKLIFEEFFFEN